VAEARVYHAIGEIGREAWDSCFPQALEGYDYLAAVEAAGLPGFDWRYVTAQAQGRVIAAAPAFLTDYSLDTTLSDRGQRMVAAARRIAPRAFTVRMACLGSPCTEDVGVGFAPGLTAAEQAAALSTLLAGFEAAAGEAGCWLLSVKDAPSAERQAWADATGRAGYQPLPGMPSAELPIAFCDLDGYLASLSGATRKDMRRKLKALPSLRIEVVRDLAGLEDRILELYRQTRERSDLQFEDLTAAYFTGVLAALGERAFCVLYWEDEALVGFNLLLQDGRTLLDKFFCMETERGPGLNLYFVSWFTNVRLCLEMGLSRYQSGQAGYETKLRLGSRLIGADMYFRHRRPLVNRALQWAGPMLADDPTAPGAVQGAARRKARARVLAAASVSAASLAAVVAMPAPALAASPEWTVDAGVAGRVRPAHMGSSQYVYDAAPILEADYGDILSISFDDGAKWRALRVGPVRAGPIVEYRQSFNDHLPPGAFRMRDAVELGGFAEWRTPLGIAEARLRRAVNAYQGWSGDLSFNTGLPITHKLTLAGQARVAWADSNFTQEYFGLKPHAASRFGLPKFLDEDYVSAGAELDVIRQLSPRVRLVTSLTADRIVSELRPSPLFSNRNMFTAAIGLTYHWSARPTGRPS
jgi:outer membrane scaffolding protein for murein synthesis (MipA/OmpV family)/predicted N-acyltransferase